MYSKNVSYEVKISKNGEDDWTGNILFLYNNCYKFKFFFCVINFRFIIKRTKIRFYFSFRYRNFTFIDNFIFFV